MLPDSNKSVSDKPRTVHSLIEQHSSNARVLSQDEFLKEFGGDKK